MRISQLGERGAGWKGGLRIQDGYRRIIIKSGNSLLGTREVYEGEHRLIAEQTLGRLLKRDEVVHHINEDRKDNRNANLLICTRGYHTFLHNRMRSSV